MNCASCHDQIPPKRLAAVPNTRFCLTCQSKRDKKIIPLDSAIAICGESDDSVRVVESGWNQTAHRTRTNHKVERVLKIYNIPA